jgi:hypothetical protein
MKLITTNLYEVRNNVRETLDTFVSEEIYLALDEEVWVFSIEKMGPLLIQTYETLYHGIQNNLK